MNDWVWDRFCQVEKEADDKIAIYHGDATISYRSLRRNAESIAANLPVAPGERVIVSAKNSISFVCTILAIWRWGAIPTLINVESSRSFKNHAVENTGAKLAFTDGSIIEDTENRPMPIIGSDTTKEQNFLPDLDCSGEDFASIIFTSGSTGAPKGVLQTSKTLITSAERVSSVLGLSSKDRILCPVPFSFDYGWGQLISLTQLGVSLVLTEPSNGFGVCTALQAHKPTVFASVPAVLSDLLMGLAPIAETPKDSIRLITNTGSRIPDRVFDLLRKQFPEAEISLNYGMTETYRTTSLPVGMADNANHSVGFPIPDVEIKIVDEKDQVVRNGDIGEIIHVGAGIFHSYWNEPEMTAAIKFAWTDDNKQPKPAVRTGDYGFIDQEGRLCIEGRRDRLVKCMGVRVSLDEIENAIAKSSSIKEVAVTAVSHDIVGVLITAHIVPSVVPDELKSFEKAQKVYARKTLSPYMQPRAWVTHFSSLPRNTNGKIDYVKLQAES